MKYNREQKEVMQATSSDLLVFAGAGTGKTTTITGYVGRLLSMGVAPDEIVCVTLTNRARRELSEHLDGSAKVNTFHGLCFEMLRTHYAQAGFSSPDILVLEAPESYDVIEMLAAELGFKLGHMAHRFVTSAIKFVADSQTWVQAASECLSSKNSKSFANQREWFEKYGSLLLQRYAEFCQKNAVVDFDLMEALAVKLTAPELQNIKYLVIDEAQDISRTEINFLLSAFGSSYVAAFGDFNQTIYTWRGSAPSYLFRRMEKRGAKQLSLIENHRSDYLIQYLAQGYLDRISGYETLLPPPQQKIQVILSGGNVCKAAVDLVGSLTDRSELAILARDNQTLDNLNGYAQVAAANKVRIGTVATFELCARKQLKQFAHLLKLFANRSNDFSSEKLIHGLEIKLDDEYVRASDLFFPTESFYEPLLSAIKTKNLCVFDLETTSTNVAVARIVQIAGYRPVTGERFNRYVNPNVPVGSSYRIHGLSDDFLCKNGESADIVLQEFRQFADSCVLVGHNVYYDLDVLAEEEARHGVRHLTPTAVYDTLKESRRFLRTLENYRLNTVREALGVSVTATHNAMSDVMATAGVLARLIRDYIVKQGEEINRRIAQYRMTYRRELEGISECMKMLEQSRFSDAVRMMCRTFGFDEEDCAIFVESLKLTGKTPVIKTHELAEMLTLRRSELDVLLKRQGKIPAITIHQSKGCEFDTVVLLDWDARYAWFEDSDEEARLFYVGLTRARRNCVIISPAAAEYGVSTRVRSLPTGCVEFVGGADD